MLDAIATMRAIAVALLLASSTLHADPLSERGLAFATAFVVPDGDVEVSGHAIVGDIGEADLAMGLGHATQLSIEAAIGDGAEHTYALGLTHVVARGATWQLALDASVRRIIDYDATAFDPINALSFGPNPSGTSTTVSAGAVGSVCGAACREMFTAGMRVAVMSDAAVLYGWLAASYGGEHVRGIAELGLLPTSGGDVAGTLGVRASWRHVALDAGLGYATTGGPSPVILPIIGVAYRP